MNLHALYFSPTKTTKTIVETICQSMGTTKTTHDISLPKNRHNKLTFGKDDCLVIGLPVYGGRIPIMTENFLLSLRGQDTPLVLLAVYGNRHYDDALLEMKNILEQQGFVAVAAGAFIGEHSYTANVASDRPNVSDLERCRDFAHQTKKLLDEKSIQEISLTLPGNFPYRDRPSPDPVGPTVSDDCIKCGKCIKTCPTGALKMTDKIEVNEKVCTRCHACTRNCPVGAIEFDNRIAHIKTWLEDNFSQAREPEVFYG